MIESLKYVAKGENIITYVKDGEKKAIKFKNIASVAGDIKKGSFEYGRAYIWGNLIGFTALIASGQSGALFVWDTEKEELVHYSDCTFGLDAVPYKEQIFLLCEVSYWGMPYHLRLYSVPFGTKDVDEQGQRLYCAEPKKYKNSSSIDDYEILIRDNQLIIRVKDNEYVYSDDVDHVKEQQMNQEFASLYVPHDGTMNQRVYDLMAMLT